MITVYGLAHPQTRRIRYVGRSVNPDRRLGLHISVAISSWRAENRALGGWIRRLLGRGLVPKVVKLERCSRLAWPATERKWIARYRRTGRIFNVRIGEKDSHRHARYDWR